MRSKIGKIVLILSLMLCMTTSMFAFHVNAEDSASTSKIDDCSKVLKAYTAERATSYLEGDSYPTKEGYLFAGWYTTDELPENDEEAVEYAVEDSVPEGVEIVYALFVPDDVLTVKAQVSVHLIDNEVANSDETGAIRFVTSVDSLLYKQVGFEVSYETSEGTKSATSASNKVYKALYQADSTTVWSATPEGTFCGVSEYFKACTVKNVPVGSYTTEFTVKPFWVTMSGDKVYGETAIKTIEEGCLRKEVYVSSTTDTDDNGNLIAQDLPQYGTCDNPYATLDYAIAHVKDAGTVRVRDELTVASTLTSWSAHEKSITITGYDEDEDAESLIFTGDELSVKDNVTFSALKLTLSKYVYANGYNLTISEDVTVESANYIYGGGKTNTVSSTCLKLYAGSYSIIYGGAHNGTVDGNTYVEIGPKVNPEAQYTEHTARNYLLFGGCRQGTVTGDTKVVVQEGAKVEHLYGGGNNADTVVEGSTYVEFAGQAYSVYGGSFKGTNGNTHVKMTGGTAYQVLGGCEGNSMTGNTDVQVLGGDVLRRIYGGCYNSWELTWESDYHVTGQTSVTMGTDVSLNTTSDQLLCAISRYGEALLGETGVMILRDGLHSSLSSKVTNFIGDVAYHYLVDASVGGDVSQAGDCIYIEPKDNNMATVRLDSSDGAIVYYAEEAGYYPLPELVNDEREIYVTFDETEATDFMNNAAAKISTANDLYAYYATLDEAIAAADKSENATITEINATDLASISITDSANGTVSSNYKNCVADTTVTLTVIPDDGYYCSALSVTKDGAPVELKEELTIDGTEYTLVTEAGVYTVEATFVKKVFKNPSASAANTKWDVMQQNESMESLVNGGTKVTGTVTATDIKGDGTFNTLNFVEKYTDMALELTVKETQETPASYSRGTQVVFDFDGYLLQIRVTHSGGKNYLRVVDGVSKNTNVHTFTDVQAAAYNSEDGVEVRFVRYGATLYMYIDGEPCDQSIDLNAYSKADTTSEIEVTETTEMTVGLKLLSDMNTTVDIPFNITDMVTPVNVNVKETTGGTVTVDKANCFTGDTVTLTVTPDDDYYCRSLSVTKGGESVNLNEEFVLDETTYTFKVEEGSYIVAPTFVKKVFDTPNSSTNTEWGLLEQNQSIENLANNGTKIFGEITVKSKTSSDDRLYLYKDDQYTDIDLTMTVKDDTASADGSPETIFTFDFGKPNGTSRVFQLKVYTTDEDVLVQSTQSSTYSGTVHTLTAEQKADYQSGEGVELRIARVGTQIFLYIDGVECDVPMIDLSEKDIAAETKFSAINIRHKGDKGTTVVMPYSIANVVVPLVNIQETEYGAITKDKSLYEVGETVTLTVEPKTDYYCKALNITKDGEAVTLNEKFAIDGETYTFEVEEGIYEVQPTFVKRVFDTPSSSTNTEWGLLEQNQSIENLVNNGTKIFGEITVKSKTSSDDRLYLYKDNQYTDIDLTMTVKDDQSSTDGSPETIFTFDFGKPSGTSRVLQLKVYTTDGNVLVQSTQSSTYSGTVHTLTSGQKANYQSGRGVELRIARVGTQIFLYIDGEECDVPMIDLSEKDITAETKFSAINIRHKGDKGATVVMPYSIANKVSPVTVEVTKDNSVITTSNIASNTQNVHLDSNSTYNVKLTTSGMETDAYFKITYVDHVTTGTQSVYTPVVAAGENFEFTYQNGIFETVDGMSTLSWENTVNATKDVLTVEVFSGAPESETIAAGAVLGRAPLAQPGAKIIEPSSWFAGYIKAGTGAETSSSSYTSTGVISIPNKGTKITFTVYDKTGVASEGAYVVSSWKLDGENWVFDADGTNIIGGKGTCIIAEESSDGLDITYTYITSKDNENIRLGYYSKNKTEYPVLYSLYTGEVGTTAMSVLELGTDEWIAQDINRVNYSILEGKTISVIGDSYLYGKDLDDAGSNNTSPSEKKVWPALLATKYGMTLNNYGLSGSTISNYAGSNYNPMVDRWEASFADDNPDIIIVEGGRNDYNRSVPMGELGTLDKATMIGATEYLISSLQTKFPDAIIIGTTCWEVGGQRNSAGYYCSDYGRAFQEVCVHLGVPFINSMDSDAMGVYMTNAEFRSNFCISANDYSHLNEKGMKLVLPVFEEKIYEFCNQ